MHITVYTKPGCHLCDEVLLMLDRMTPSYDIELTEVNIIEDMTIYEQYKYVIPVVEVTDAQVGRLVAPITEPELRAYFEMARGAGDSRSGSPEHDTLFSRLAKWISNH